jgi:hypothetical protein
MLVVECIAVFVFIKNITVPGLYSVVLIMNAIISCIYIDIQTP